MRQGIWALKTGKRAGPWARIGALLFFILSILGWLRFEQAILNWRLLLEFGAYPGPLYIAISGLLWGLVGLPPAWGLWFHRPWAFKLARFFAPIYPLTYWIDKLAFNNSPQRLQNWPFALGMTLIWLALIFLALPDRLFLSDRKQRIDHDQR